FYLVSSGERVCARVDTPEQAAKLLCAHWKLGGAGVVLAQPIVADVALAEGEFEVALRQAERKAADASVRGKELTPVLLSRLANAIYHCYERGRTVFLCGNGGSGSNASHFCEDLGKGTLRREDFDNDAKKRLRVLSLTDNTPYILAWGNDEGFERVFVEQLKNLAAPGDLLIAISGSGNSPNILRAVEWANRHGLRTFGCTGFDGGKLRQLAHQGLHVPLDD